MRSYKIVFFPLILVLIGFWFILTQKNEQPMISKTESYLSMSTAVEVFLSDPSPQRLDLATAQIRAVFRETEAHCNIFTDASELARINAATTFSDTTCVCSPFLYNIIAWADTAYHESNHAFDPTIRPLMQLWGFHRKHPDLPLPTTDSIREVMSRIGFQHVRRLPNGEVHFAKGITLDLGGIAKGYALDCAAEKARASGICQGVINLGGNIITWGETPASFSIANPLNPEKSILTSQIINAAVSTSGNYERYVSIQGKRYGHILNPQTGYPVSDSILAVTVIHKHAIVADYLSTTAFIEGKDFAKKYILQHPETVFVVFESDPNTALKFSYTIIGTPPFPINEISKLKNK